MNYFVYVLESLSVKKSYVGITDDVNRRLAEHNSGKHFYTKRHLPWQVIRLEKYDSVGEARRREKYLKSAAGRRWLRKVVWEIV